jgi:hypothetical protein
MFGLDLVTLINRLPSDRTVLFELIYGEYHMSTSREMPRYKCHKIVHALKIASVELRRPTINELQEILDGGKGGPAAIIMPAEEGFGPFPVSQEYITKHKPEAGGYYVVYDDGYASFSPAKAFEEGYARI